MKKVLLLLAGVALLAVFSTSCNKGCVCKQKVAGVVVQTWDQEVADGESCSDFSDPTMFIECK